MPQVRPDVDKVVPHIVFHVSPMAPLSDTLWSLLWLLMCVDSQKNYQGAQRTPPASAHAHTVPRQHSQGRCGGQCAEGSPLGKPAQTCEK